ncbi:hypothetical protein RFI_31044 [Reticulomyxa filosa]|uniref:Uncharacterized protein n=1 Tax=Reticulomyxa filosa TaxID=46433 RepID=X6LXK6_RETFI|nr:hypothetical protein RFI_31044 [Reticulomyxa filosa]|eukprot:ETO06349.1 hypothetical protein RFI_31044 [Reticulomyxa filosa]
MTTVDTSNDSDKNNGNVEILDPFWFDATNLRHLKQINFLKPHSSSGEEESDATSVRLSYFVYYENGPKAKKVVIVNKRLSEEYNQFIRHSSSNWTSQHQLFQSGVVDIHLNFGIIPYGAQLTHTLALHNDNPLSLKVTPMETTLLPNQKSTLFHIHIYIYMYVYGEAKSEWEQYALNDPVHTYLHRRELDLKPSSVDVIESHAFSYLTIGLSTTGLYESMVRSLCDDDPYESMDQCLSQIGGFVSYAFLNVSAMAPSVTRHIFDNDLSSNSSDPWPNDSEQEKLTCNTVDAMACQYRWMNTALRNSILRIRVEWNMAYGHYQFVPNPIAFGPSWPYQSPLSRRLFLVNHYNIDLQIRDLMLSNDDSVDVILTNTIVPSHSMVGCQMSIYIKISMSDNTNANTINNNNNKNKRWKLIELCEESLLKNEHFVSSNAYQLYLLFHKMVDENPNMTMTGLHDNKGVSLLELVVDNYRGYMWNTLLQKNLTEMTWIVDLWSPQLGKIPLLIQASLQMPSIIQCRGLDFGMVDVGSSLGLYVPVANVFNQTIEISFAQLIDTSNAVFIPTVKSLVLHPFEQGFLGPVYFFPRHIGFHSTRLYLRNNHTFLESVQVNGTGMQGTLHFQSVSSPTPSSLLPDGSVFIRSTLHIPHIESLSKDKLSYWNWPDQEHDRDGDMHWNVNNYLVPSLPLPSSLNTNNEKDIPGDDLSQSSDVFRIEDTDTWSQTNHWTQSFGKWFDFLLKSNLYGHTKERQQFK